MDHFDDDADATRRAHGPPPPPDQRVWRHPSEMSGVAARAAHTPPPVGRRRRETLLSAGAGVLGAVGAGVLLLVLLPGSTGQPPALVAPSPSQVATPVAGDSGTKTTPVVSTSAPIATTAPAVSTAPVVVEPSAPTSAPPLSPPPTLAALPEELSTPGETPEAQPWVPTVSRAGLPRLVHNGATAVPLHQSEFLLTTTQAVGQPTGTVELVWDGAPSLLATIVARGSGFTVLQLDRQITATSGLTLAEALPEPGTWVTVGLVEPRRGMVVEREGGLAVAGVPASVHDIEGVPVLDAEGRLVGLCSHSRAGTVLVPVTDAHEVIDERGQHAWLGISATTTTSEDEPTVVVTEVAAAGPADRAGLRAGDLVIALDDQPVHTVVQLAAMVERRRPGDEVIATIRRGESILEVLITLNARPFSL